MSVTMPQPMPTRRPSGPARLLRWWMRLLRGELGRKSLPSESLVEGKVFVRLPDAPDVDRLTVHAASDTVHVSSSLRWFGFARARHRWMIELPGGGKGVVLGVKKGHEDALIKRLHAWLMDELDVYGAQTDRHRDSEVAKVRHLRSWSNADSLRQREVEGRLDVFVACRIPYVMPAGVPPALSTIRELEGSTVDDRGPEILLMDTGIDQEWLSSQRFDISRVKWLPAPRQTAAGPYEGSIRPGDRRVGGHGTAMAAAIWERAPNATITVLPVLEAGPGAQTPGDLMVVGILIAHGQPELQHVNLSLTVTRDAELFLVASGVEVGIKSMLRRGAVVVAAVGNAHPADIGLGWPASVAGVIAIGAVCKGGDGFRKCPDSRYDSRADLNSLNFWVEEGGHLEKERVITPGIVANGTGFAGSSVACARASGSIAAWRYARAQATGRLPSARETRDNLLAASQDGLQALVPAERGNGWARPL
jgi:hypothetical protein